MSSTTGGIVAKFAATVVEAPQLRHTPAGAAWVRLSVWVDAPNDADASASVRVSLFGPTVPDLAPQLVPGVRVFCSGRLRLRSWKTESGERRAALDLVARKIEILHRCRVGKPLSVVTEG